MTVNLVKRDGVVAMDKPFSLVCSSLKNGEYTLKVEPRTEPRTLPQNRVMWMWIQCMEASTCTPKEDFHAYYKALFLKKEVAINGRSCFVAGETKKLNKTQMSLFLTKVQVDALQEFGITLPLPEDKGFQEFVDYYKNR